MQAKRLGLWHTMLPKVGQGNAPKLAASPFRLPCPELLPELSLDFSMCLSLPFRISVNS